VPTKRSERRHPLALAARVVSVLSIAVAGALALAILLIIAAPNLDPFPVGEAFVAGAWLAGPFDGLFPVRGTGLYVLANWGLAALVWLVVGQIVSLVLRRADGQRLGAAE
jgi:hypothetical protein